ncbi:unnamed protein product [Cercopithifilaria johnstoni]|uniref:Glycosyl transferase CAP10 domain-containing protein n=1 Tax=Cercopithifilaria johnstoni TaxID=2874296 RepID=A0A8J2PYK7_9BILA|nr:unnamed protein product [Cercopithifilaria johnstoni]
MESIDGTVAAYRFPFLLAGDSVVFKSFSDYYAVSYMDLKEGLHYFHFNNSTLIEQIKWARTEDHNKTLNAMNQFVLQHLQPLDIYCYYADFVQTLNAMNQFVLQHLQPLDIYCYYADFVQVLPL